MKRREKVIRYQHHAEQRMAARGIDKRQVEKVVRDPDTVRPANRDNADRLEKAISRRRRLAVIASEHRSEFWIISAFWMSK